MRRIAAVLVALLLAPVPALNSAAGAQDEPVVPGPVACPDPGSPPIDVPPDSAHAAMIACALARGLLPDLGSFEPDRAATREDVLLALATILVDAGVPLYAPNENLFPDDDGHFTEATVGALAVLGIVTGTSDGAVDVELEITRAQLAAILMRSLRIVTLDDSPSLPVGFTDLGDSALHAEVRAAVAAGLLQGRSPTEFAPTRLATRAQVATALVHLLDLLTVRGAIPAPISAVPVRVVPARVSDTIPGQRVVLLVTVEDDSGGTLSLTATAPGFDVFVEDALPTSGQVVEITVIPTMGEPPLGAVPIRPQPVDPIDPVEPPVDPDYVPSQENVVPLTITVTSGDESTWLVVPVHVSPGVDDLESAARGHLEPFLVWLAAEHPELGLDPSTELTPTIVRPHILVVSHYLFFSAEWEIGLTWHVMIPPYDWARIYLRPRDSLSPTMGFEISSVSAPDAVPVEMEPPAEIDR